MRYRAAGLLPRSDDRSSERPSDAAFEVILLCKCLAATPLHTRRYGGGVPQPVPLAGESGASTPGGGAACANTMGASGAPMQPSCDVHAMASRGCVWDRRRPAHRAEPAGFPRHRAPDSTAERSVLVSRRWPHTIVRLLSYSLSTPLSSSSSHLALPHHSSTTHTHTTGDRLSA